MTKDSGMADLKAINEGMRTLAQEIAVRAKESEAAAITLPRSEVIGWASRLIDMSLDVSLLRLEISIIAQPRKVTDRTTVDEGPA